MTRLGGALAITSTSDWTKDRAYYAVVVLIVTYAYDRQQVIYIFDKMRVNVNTQKSHVKNVIHRDCRQTDHIILEKWRTPGSKTVH